MRYRPKSIVALHIALGGLPNKMRVEVDRGVGVSASMVGELRKLTDWPENLVISTPTGGDPEGVVKVSKATKASRTSPKP
jgi:hypothetical protein